MEMLADHPARMVQVVAVQVVSALHPDQTVAAQAVLAVKIALTEQTTIGQVAQVVAGTQATVLLRMTARAV
jgi:hypothetical protein